LLKANKQSVRDYASTKYAKHFSKVVIIFLYKDLSVSSSSLSSTFTIFCFSIITYGNTIHSVETRNVEAVEYFLLPYKVSRFRICFHLQFLSSKCFRFHKNLTASASTSLPMFYEKCFRFGSSKNVKCF